MKTLRFGRRGLLTGFAASAAALPFIPLPSNAADGEYPKRLIIVHTPNGTVMDSFWPASGFELGSILSPLEPYKSRLIVMRGVDMKSAGVSPVPKDHWPDSVNALTARQGIIKGDQTCDIGGKSIDQHIIENLEPTPFGSIHLGLQTYGGSARLCATGPQQPIPPQTSPSAAFDTLFSELDLDPFELEALRARRRSVLDTVGSELEALQCELTGSYREKLQSHLASIRKMEESLETGGDYAECSAPQIEAVDPDADTQYPTAIAQHFDIITQALACDLARVATFQLKAGSIHHNWVGIDQSHHGISHGSEGVTAGVEQRIQWLIEIENWYALQFKTLLDRLDAVPEGDGTLLDHSLVVWAHEQSDGGSHKRSDMPYVMAGGLHGTIEMGRKIDAGGVPHSRLLVSLAEAMGVPTEQFGDPQFDSSPLTDFYAP